MPRRDEVLRDRTYRGAQQENCRVRIGSPRLEVGVDLSRVNGWNHLPAMRDPSSLQQKVGRVGRESNADSVRASRDAEHAGSILFSQPADRPRS